MWKEERTSMLIVERKFNKFIINRRWNKKAMKQNMLHAAIYRNDVYRWPLVLCFSKMMLNFCDIKKKKREREENAWKSETSERFLIVKNMFDNDNQII